jgi:NitT/TauT family transport system permease protein
MSNAATAQSSRALAPRAGTRGIIGWTPDRSMRRAVISLVLFLIVWQIGSTSRIWLGMPLPVIGAVPSPDSVVRAWAQLLSDPGYWQSWMWSVLRVSLGFAAAALVGIPFGLALAANATFRGVAFPVFELLRPIPPLAWVPASIIFWPTQELSIAFVIFLGGFYTIVLNVIGGAEAIDARLIQSARSMGATRRTIFRRLILPGVLPSIGVGMQVAIGITWEVVVAAEMISGGGSGGAASSGGGLGFFIWNSYVGGAYPDIIVGMISIGIAGYLSSALVRLGVARLTPWLKRGRA